MNGQNMESNDQGTLISDLVEKNQPKPTGINRDYYMKELAKNVNDSLDVITTEKDEDIDNIMPIKGDIESNNNVKYVTEYLLLLLIYVTMSQPRIYNLFTKYVNQLYSDGTIKLSGLIIYGSIMIILFMSSRHLIFKYVT